MNALAIVDKILVVLWCALVFAQPALSQTEPYVPADLQPWVKWVQERHPEWNCAVLRDSRTCVWPGRVALDLNRAGGTFSYSVVMDREGEVAIPGGGNVWPLEVTRTGSGSGSVRIVERDGHPYAYLSAGRHELRGVFRWDALPEFIPVPVVSALVELQLEGRTVEAPRVTERGELWLQRVVSAEVAEEDRLTISVQRRLADGVPFRIDTRLTMRISGKGREIRLGNILPEGAVPVELTSNLSYRLDSGYQIVLQGKPGVHTVLLEAVMDHPPVRLGPVGSAVEGWPANEVWIWVPNEDLRSVDLTGATRIDPERTELPPEWKPFPTFQLASDSSLNFEESRRGQPELPPNQLTLQRKLWLDLDGRGYTVQDSLNGTLYRDWRLNVQQGMTLGHVASGGSDLLITKDVMTGLSGIELREQALSLTAESRLEDPGASLMAVGWDHDVNSLNVQLALPPGWTLLEATGVDNLSNSWVASWTLLDLFVVLLVAAATGKLLGWRWAVVALVALVLAHRVSGAPGGVWFHLLAAVALLRVLPDGTLRRWISAYFYVAFAMLVLNLGPFALHQARIAIYPQLDFGGGDYQGLSADIYGMLGVVEGAVGGLLVVGGLIGGVILLFRRSFGQAFALFGLVIALLIARSFTQTFFNVASRDISQMDTSSAPAGMGAPVPRTSPQELATTFSGDIGGLLEPQKSISSGSALYEMRRQELQKIDPHAVVQTGPGVPSWNWRWWYMGWNGPVSKDHSIRLYLLGPGGNGVMAIARVILFVMLAYGFFAGRRREQRTVPSGGILVAAAIALTANVPAAHAQNLPDSELLNELENRYAALQCSGACLAVHAVKLDVSGDNLKVVAQVTSRGPSAWPLPGPLLQFYPTSVRVDDVETSALRHDGNGVVWVRIPDGAHRVALSGNLGRRSLVTLQFPERPGHVEVVTDGWEVDGVSPTGSIETSVQLTRTLEAVAESIDAAEGTGPSSDSVLPNWYIVRRELQLGLPWTVRTVVSRVGGVERPTITRIPLLDGESVTTDRILVESGQVLVSFPREVREVEWSSTLREEPTLRLVAATQADYTENWVLGCSTMWRCAAEGINPVATLNNGQHVTSWAPWPGEEVTINVARPAGVEGAAKTIDSVILTHRPGVRLLESELELAIRASQGGFQHIVLPEEATVRTIRMDGVERMIRPEGSNLALPIEPGSHRFQISWQHEWDEGFTATMPAVEVDGGAVNVTTTVSLPPKRWILWAQGPSWGPAVLFWSKLVVILLAAFLLGRTAMSPLRTHEWLLLLLGLATLSVPLMAIPVVWLFLLRYRGERPQPKRWLFNLTQLFLVLLTLVSFGVLYAGVHHGLILYPDMQVQGNGSTNSLLRWYVDQTKGPLPRPTVISAPLWLWRVLMLAWSFWLVISLLRWLREGWKQFATAGLWRTKPT